MQFFSSDEVASIRHSGQFPGQVSIAHPSEHSAENAPALLQV
jgi:hypothetical protein